VLATLDLIKKLRAMSPEFETPYSISSRIPGSQITGDLARTDILCRNPMRMGGFDYLSSSGPWVAPRKFRLIERFKFFNRFAWGPESRLRRPLQKIARWRCRRNMYGAPLEKLIVERLRPRSRLT